jgi:hypothetical protein
LNVVDALDMDDLWRQANDRLLWAEWDDLDLISSLDTMMTDCVAHAESMSYSLNMGRDIWLTPVRWTTMVRQYIDPQNLEVWLEDIARMGHKGRGINAMNMKGVGATTVDANARASRRKWGGCMRMATYRTFPRPTISLYSRTSYLGYIGALDLMIARKLAELASEIIDVPVEDFSFTWHCDAWQFHGFKSMAYIFATDQEEYLGGYRPKLEHRYPTWKLVRNWYQRIHRQDEEGLLYGDMKYSAEKRIRRRMHAVTGAGDEFTDDKHKEYGPLDVPIETLSIAGKINFNMPHDVEVQEIEEEDE